MKELPGEPCIYPASDSVQVDDRVPPEDHKAAQRELWNDVFFENCQARSDVELKIGAQVMLVKNLNDSNLFNGAKGILVKWMLISIVIKQLETHKFQTIAGWDRVKIEKQITWLRGCQQKYVPVVRFACGVEVVMLPELFKAEVSGTGVCKRWQIPLKVSLHNSKLFFFLFIKTTFI